ncbi:MAG: hypothetical protein AAGA23_20665 [Pseudomonadota bacterium]
MFSRTLLAAVTLFISTGAASSEVGGQPREWRAQEISGLIKQSGKAVPELAVHIVRGWSRCRFSNNSDVTNESGEFSIQGPQLPRGTSLSATICIYNGAVLVARDWFASNAEKFRLECNLSASLERVSTKLDTNNCEFART